MPLKLHKTLLNHKLSFASKMTGFLSLFFLIFMFSLREENLMANGHLIFGQGQYWKLWTSAFVHADYKHLGTNAVYFTILATILNNYFGNFLFPILSFAMAGIINWIVLFFYPPQVYLVGISGVVYFMAAMWLTLYLMVERTTRLNHRLIIATGLTLIFLAPEIVLKENVSYLAHFVGFVLGVPSAYLFYRMSENEIRAHDLWREQKPEPLWVKEWEEYNQQLLEEDALSEDRVLKLHPHQTQDNYK